MSKILIGGPAWVGDMVMAQALFKTLKQLDPTCLLDVLVSAWSRPIMDRLREIRQALTLAPSHGALKLKIRYQLAKTIQSYQYDQAIILLNSWKSTLIPWWAKILKRSGWLGEYLGQHQTHLTAEFSCSPCFSKAYRYQTYHSVDSPCFITISPDQAFEQLRKIVSSLKKISQKRIYRDPVLPP